MFKSCLECDHRLVPTKWNGPEDFCALRLTSPKGECESWSGEISQDCNNCKYPVFSEVIGNYVCEAGAELKPEVAGKCVSWEKEAEVKDASHPGLGSTLLNKLDEILQELKRLNKETNHET